MSGLFVRLASRVARGSGVLLAAGFLWAQPAAALQFPREGYVTVITDPADPEVEPCRDILAVGYQQDGMNSYFSVTVNCTDVGFNNQRFMLYLDTDGDGVNDRLLWMENPQVTRLFAWDGTRWQDTISPSADFLDPDLTPDDTIFLGVATAELGLAGGGGTLIGASTATSNVKLIPTCNDPACQGAGDTTGDGDVGVANLSLSPDVACASETLTATAVRLDTRALTATFSWFRPDGTSAGTSGPVPFVDGAASASFTPPGPEGYWRVETTYAGVAGAALPDAGAPESDVLFARVNLVVADAGVDAAICPGGGAQIGGAPAASGGTAPFVYAWLPAEGLDDPAAPNPTAAPVTTTVYTLTVVGTSGCVGTDSVTVSVAPCDPALLRLALGAGASPRTLDGALDVEVGSFASGADFPHGASDLAPEAPALILYGVDLPTDTLRVTVASGRVRITY